MSMKLRRCKVSVYARAEVPWGQNVSKYAHREEEMNLTNAEKWCKKCSSDEPDISERPSLGCHLDGSPGKSP